LMATLGTTYVEIGRVTSLAWAASVSMGCLACAILVLNNLRDIESDRAAGKLTLAVRLGRAGTRRLLLALLAAAYLPPLAVLALGQTRWPAVLPLVSVAVAVPVYRMSASVDARTLVSALKRCAELEVWFALLWTLGVLAA
jgi:1,4-dihydroxy-2-naphthoate octaprenyltransferase